MMNSSVNQLFPSFILSDKNGYAMARAIARALQIVCDTVQDGIDTVMRIDKMPEWRLDELAWEFNITWYDYAASIDEKREQIKGAMSYYDRLGTPAAVRRAISDVYGAGYVSEWFEYGGEPYHFKVYTTNVSVLHENRERFIKLLDKVKNVRSVLDNLYYNGNSSAAKLYAATKCTGVMAYASGTARNYYKE